MTNNLKEKYIKKFEKNINLIKIYNDKINYYNKNIDKNRKIEDNKELYIELQNFIYNYEKILFKTKLYNLIINKLDTNQD